MHDGDDRLGPNHILGASTLLSQCKKLASSMSIYTPILEKVGQLLFIPFLALQHSCGNIRRSRRIGEVRKTRENASLGLRCLPKRQLLDGVSDFSVKYTEIEEMTTVLNMR